MAAPSQTRPQFNTVKELVKYLNDHQVGVPTIDPSTGAYKVEIFATPIDFGRVGNTIHDQGAVDSYVNMLIRAIEGEAKNQGFEGKIDALMRTNGLAIDYQFIRRALDNNGRAR